MKKVLAALLVIGVLILVGASMASASVHFRGNGFSFSVSPRGWGFSYGPPRRYYGPPPRYYDYYAPPRRYPPARRYYGPPPRRHAPRHAPRHYYGPPPYYHYGW
jgi:hypothetical protein